MDHTPEFSRPLPVGHITEAHHPFDVTASPAEREALARRFDLVAVERVTAEGEVLRAAKPGRYHLSGRLRATVTETCGITLEPFTVDLDVPFERVYASDVHHEWGEGVGAGVEVVLSLDDNDPPQPLIGGVLDVGDAVAEELGLALDPFPRAPGVAFEGYSTGASSSPAAEDRLADDRTRPFAALLALKEKTAKKRG